MPTDISSGNKPFLKKFTNSLAKIALGAGLAIAPAAVFTGAATYPTNAEAKEVKCVPHYLQGLTQPKDKLENMLEKDRVYSTLKTKYPYKNRYSTLNGSMEVQAKIHEVNATLIFPNYVRQGDKINHYHSMGIDVYSQMEFQCVINDNIEYIRESATLAMKDYENLLPLVLDAQEKMLRKSGSLKEGENLKDFLDKDVEGYPGLKARDILFTPDTKIQDFIPRQYYFGEIPALGVTYINAGIIGIDPKARILDYINGWPTIMVHEMTHRNPKLQSYPMLHKFDAELWASFPELVHEDMMHFLNHPYLEDIRKVSKILFHFDSELAYQDIVKLRTMIGCELESNKKLKEYIEQVTRISQEIRDTAFNKYVPEFYTHPLYFMTLNEFMNDNNAAFKLIMYMTHEPTLLGGPEYDKNGLLVSFPTRDFIQENKDVIEESFRTVMRMLRNNREDEVSEEYKAKVKAELERRLSRMGPEKERMLTETAKRFGMPTTGKIEDLIKFGLKLHRVGIVNIDIKEEEQTLIP